MKPYYEEGFEEVFMKLDEAIKILTAWKEDGECNDSQKLEEAENLGIEALKRILLQHNPDGCIMTEQKSRPDKEKIARELFRKYHPHPFGFRSDWEEYYKEADQILAICEEEIRKEIAAEFALKFNPDYLNYQKGVRSTEKIWKERVRQAVKDERERIAKQIIDMYDGTFPEAYNEAIRRMWQALKEEK